MPTLPGSTVTVSETAGALASGLDTICIWAPVATSADATPRLFGSADAIYTQHGYSEGLEYAASHIARTGKPVLFVGLAIATAGTIGREDTSGNSGTSVTSLAAGGSGTLNEHDGVLRVPTGGGGTIGTDQIKLELSLDGGVNFKAVRLGTASSYAIPYEGITVSFAAGTLVAGDTIHTWHASAPVSDSTGWALARAAMAAQQRQCRSVLLTGDMTLAAQATALLTQINAYKTSNKRALFARASVLERLPLATSSTTQVRMTGSPTITFAEVGATGDTITRSTGSFVTDGFVVGDIITITGAVASAGANNITTAVGIASVTATVITLDTDDLVDEGPIAGVSIVGTPAVTFAEVGATGDTITRSRGSWLDDGFRVGDVLTIAGSSSNDATHSSGITGVTATVITLDDDDLAAEVIGLSAVTVSAGQTKAVWMAAADALFASVDGEHRLSLSAGRGRISSPFSGWYFRRSAGWFASLREYAHDIQVATWRKSDGPVGADLFDTSGNLAEWDDEVDGGAGTAAKFTTLRTWSTGPNGGFIARSLSRATDSSLLVNTSNVAVVNLAENICQAAQENAAIGVDLILNEDGTASSDSLATVEDKVNRALALALLSRQAEGQRASYAKWTVERSTLFNVPDPEMVGTLDTVLNGKTVTVTTTVKIATAGA